MKLGFTNLREADDQEIFDHVAKALLIQGERAFGDRGNGRMGCMYRTPEGTMCAIGHLLSEVEQTKIAIGNMHSCGIPDLDVAFDAGLTEDRVAFLQNLQCLHDETTGITKDDFREQLIRRLDMFGVSWNLNTDILFNWHEGVEATV